MKDLKIRKVYKKILAILAVPFFLTGCMKSDCDIKETHVHKYIGTINRGYKGIDNDYKIINYYDSEDLNKGNEIWIEEEGTSGRYYPATVYYTYQDDYFNTTKDDIEFYKVKGDLFNGIDNWDFLYSVMARFHDYLEYELHFDDGDGSTWDEYQRRLDKSRATGNIRIRHIRFFGYKIIYKDGKYEKIQSPLVDDIRDIIDEYPYFDIECYKSVYKYYKFNKNELSSIKLEDIDDFNQPDLANKELYSNTK